MGKHTLGEEAARIRRENPAALPQPLGTQPTFGFGDRIGLATPGHIQALRRFRPAGLAPVLAQQSIRELSRTGRTLQEVMNAALVAIHRVGWNEPWGADADHLKTKDDLINAVQAGFTMFTIDPSDRINQEAASLSGPKLEEEFAGLFDNRKAAKNFIGRYTNRSFPLSSGEKLSITEEEAKQTAVTYMRALDHVIALAKLAADLWKQAEPFDLEVSVDETETPTTPAAHYIIVSELIRAGVRITSIAPRFVGRFEKGIDYRGSIAHLADHIRCHADIARTLGPYKLSLHSGSDKFSVYPVLVDHAGPLVHVKTSGTSYLEALRVVARHDCDLFRAIATYSIRLFHSARASYHLSTELHTIPDPECVPDEDLESRLLDTPGADDARQVLHVAYGEILTHAEYGRLLREVLETHYQEYTDRLADHFERHLRGLA